MYIYRKSFGYEAEGLPVSAKLHFQDLALPLYESLSEQQRVEVAQRLQETVCESVESS